MKKKKLYDVIVVGGGPSGLNTARLLTDNNLEVLILEAKNSVGKDVVCTGIVGIDTFRRFNISKKSVLYEPQAIELISPSGDKIFYNHPFPFASVVSREIFDNQLLEQAVKNGAQLSLNSRVFDISHEKNYISVTYATPEIPKETIKGRFVVIATGINYNLNKLLGLGFPKYFLKAVQGYGYFKNGDKNNIKILVANGIAKNGFGWVVPIDNNIARVGLITDGDPEKGFEYIRNTFYSEPSALIFESLRYKPIAQGIVSKTFGERVVVVGEAAGQIKTTTGGGLYFGLLCSELASKTIKEAFDENNFSEERLSIYEKQWKSLISEEIKKGMIIRRLCGRLSDRQIEKIFKIVKSDGFFDYITKNADFNWHSIFVLNLYKKIKGFYTDS